MSRRTTPFGQTGTFFYLAAVFSLLLLAPIAQATPFGERIGGVRIPFIANRGQTDPAVAYYAPTFAGTVYVTRKGEIVYSLPALAKDTGDSSGSPKTAREKTGGSGWTLTETAVGGSTRVTAEQRAVTRINYFIGNDPGDWRSGVDTYEGVGLGEVWPGVFLSLRAYGDNVEKLFTVRPGADPSRIRMHIAGAESLRVNEAGALVMATRLGEVTFTRPVAFQEQDGVRRVVTVAYRAQGRDYGFSVSGYDPALPVVIDPLLQATYLGGSGGDPGWALAIHPTTGEVFVAGETSSTNFPGTTGGAQPAFGGGFGLFGDVFVARLNATLTTLTQATYLGGSSDEEDVALAIHPTSGEVLIAGTTYSTNFPGTTGGAQPAHRGGAVDAFVARLNATLTTLSQATYLGGSRPDRGYALAIHPTTGEVLVAGLTDSTNFPGTAGGAQPGYGGRLDAFVARLNATLTTLSQATYLGGGGQDLSFALAIHPTSGEVFVTGITGGNFPGTTGGAQPAFGGGSDDAFVARLNATLTTLSQATYLGGGGLDLSFALAIHPTSGEVFVVGATISNDFPGTTGGAQPAFGGGSGDTFVARLNATLTTLSQATYLGGSGGEGSRSALAIHPTSGEVYVAGGTGSTNFPGTTGGAQPAFGGGSEDAFVARLNATLTTLSQATYLGGLGGDRGYALAIHPTSGEVYVAGSTATDATQTNNFPGTTGGAQPASGGLIDAFVARLTADLAGGAPPTMTNGPPPNGTVGLAYDFTYTSTGSPTFSVTAGSLPPGLSLSSAGVISGTPSTAGTFTGTVTASNGTAPNATQNFSIIISPAPPSITNGPPPNGMVGVAYSFTYTSTGSPTFGVTAGSLPPGLSLSSAGVISGTPSTAGTFTGTVTASNGTAPNATQNFSITISPAATAIPTLGGWALILLSVLLAGAGIRMCRL